MSEQLYVVEMEAEGGYRFWSKPMPASEVDAYIANEESWGCSYSDTDTYHPLEV